MNGPNIDARRAHVDPEHGETLMLGGVKVVAREQQAIVRIVGARGPYLLAADEPALAPARRAGAQSGDVGPGARLGEELTPDLLAPQRGADESALHIGRGEFHEGGHAHAETDAEIPLRSPAAALLLGEDGLLNGGTAAAAPFDRPGDARVARVRLARLPGARDGEIRGAEIWTLFLELAHVGIEPGPNVGSVSRLLR